MCATQSELQCRVSRDRTPSRTGWKELYSPLLLGCEHGIQRFHALAGGKFTISLGWRLPVPRKEYWHLHFEDMPFGRAGPVRSQRMTNNIRTVADGRSTLASAKNSNIRVSARTNLLFLGAGTVILQEHLSYLSLIGDNVQFDGGSICTMGR